MTTLLVVGLVLVVVAAVVGASLCRMSTLCERDAERQWRERQRDAD